MSRDPDPQPEAGPSEARKDKAPLFVERQTYRRRRLVDAARALPVLGVMLWLVPLLWASPDTPVSGSSALIYIFAVWCLLPLVAGLLIRAMNRRNTDIAQPDEDGS